MVQLGVGHGINGFLQGWIFAACIHSRLRFGGCVYRNDDVLARRLKIKYLMIPLRAAGNLDHIGPDDKERTVFVDNIGVKGTDFSLSKKKIEELIESGRKATHAYFRR